MKPHIEFMQPETQGYCFVLWSLLKPTSSEMSAQRNTSGVSALTLALNSKFVLCSSKAMKMPFQVLQNTHYSPHLRNRFTFDYVRYISYEISIILDFCVQMKLSLALRLTSQGTKSFSLIKSNHGEKYMFVDLHI